MAVMVCIPVVIEEWLCGKKTHALSMRLMMMMMVCFVVLYVYTYI